MSEEAKNFRNAKKRKQIALEKFTAAKEELQKARAAVELAKKQKKAK